MTTWFVYWRYESLRDRWNLYGFPRSHDQEPPLMAWISGDHDDPESRQWMCDRLGRAHGVKVHCLTETSRNGNVPSHAPKGSSG